MPIGTVTKVIDVSAAAAVLFGEPAGISVAERIRGVRLVAPALWLFELTNTCLKKLRRDPERRQPLLEAYALHTLLHVEELAVDHAAVLRLADTTGLSAYDASYLWLARDLGVELVTLDNKLGAAAV